MGVSQTPEQLVGKMRGVGQAVKSSKDVTHLRPVADVVKVQFLRSAATSGLRPGSIIAKRPWRGVYQQARGQAIAVGYAKPAHLVDSESKAHPIMPGGRRVFGRQLVTLLGGATGQRGLRTRSKRTGKVLSAGAGSGFIAAYVPMHPGVRRGKHFFQRAKQPAKTAAAKKYHDGVVTNISAALK